MKRTARTGAGRRCGRPSRLGRHRRDEMRHLQLDEGRGMMRETKDAAKPGI